MSYIPNIDEIQKFRKKLGIERNELAKAIGVTTNMISQIETKRAKPNAENYKKIIEYFYQISDKNETTLEEIWANPIKFLTPRQSILKAKEYFDSTLDIDVLPVLNNEEDRLLLGKISRINFDEKMKDGKLDLQTTIVKDILEEAPPTFPHDTPKTQIRQILQVRNSCVLVAKGNKITGIVNYWDYFSK